MRFLTHIPLGKSVRGWSTNKEGSNTWSILMSAGVMGGRPGVNPLSWAATGSREQTLHYTLRLLGTTGKKATKNITKSDKRTSWCL